MQLLRKLRGQRDDDSPPTDETAEVRRALEARHLRYEDEIRMLRLRKDRRLRGMGQ